MTTFAIVYILALIVCLALFTAGFHKDRNSNFKPESVDVMVFITLSVMPFVNILTAITLLYIAYTAL